LEEIARGMGISKLYAFLDVDTKQANFSCIRINSIWDEYSVI